MPAGPEALLHLHPRIQGKFISFQPMTSSAITYKECLDVSVREIPALVHDEMASSMEAVNLPKGRHIWSGFSQSGKKGVPM